MAVHRSKSLDDQDMTLRLKELASENRRLQRRIVKLEVANGSLKNKNAALEKSIEKRANEILNEMLGQIMKRAGDDCGPGPAKSRRGEGKV